MVGIFLSLIVLVVLSAGAGLWFLYTDSRNDVPEEE